MQNVQLANPSVSARRYSDPLDANFLGQRAADSDAPIRHPKPKAVPRRTPRPQSAARDSVWKEWLAQYFEAA